MIRITAGDSYWEDISRVDGLPMDEHWQGRWGIVTEPGTDPVATGTMLLQDDEQGLMLRITEADTIDIPAGDYILILKATNDETGFSKEFRKEPMEISAASV